MLGKLMLGVVSCLLCCTSASAKDNSGQEILEMEKAALDRWSEGDVYGFIEIAADDISYFDPSLASRIDGKAAFKAHLEPTYKKFSIHRYEILNPKSYSQGDICVLCFNLNNYNEQGEITSQWNSTEVYRKTDGKWRIIHSHWSRTHTEDQ
jgi:ketosteroid isomerase-like protein